MRGIRLSSRLLLLAFVTAGVLLFGQWSPAEPDVVARGLAVWRGMESALVGVPRREQPLEVRVADEPDERAQGMQYLPAIEIRGNPIWFAYNSARVTHWHMRNVAIPLDIIWMDANGQVLAIARMEPGDSGYRSPSGVRYALELAAGQAKRLGIRSGMRLRMPDMEE